MSRVPTKQSPLDLNAVRICAVFAVVFQHAMGAVFNSRNAGFVSHAIYSMPFFTSLLLFSGMAMGMMRMPATLGQYPRYLRTHALGYLHVYTVLFVVQSGLVVMNHHIGLDDVGGQQLDLSVVAKAYILADGYGSWSIWYMHMLAMVVAVWPLTRLVRRVPVWAVFGGLLAIGSCPRVAGSDIACRLLYCMAAMYFGRHLGWLRSGNHWRFVCIFGLLYVASTVSLLILILNKTLLPYHTFHFETNDTSYIISYLMVTTSRFSGAFFFISVVGIIGSRLSWLRAWVAKCARVSLYIYLVHRAVMLAGLFVTFNYIQPAMVPWSVLPKCAAVLLIAVLLTIIGYYVGVFAQSHPRLDYLVFAKGRRPQSGGRTRQTT